MAVSVYIEKISVCRQIHNQVMCLKGAKTDKRSQTAKQQTARNNKDLSRN